MYVRKDYLEQITPFIDKPVIKVVTGMRRVGKSCFLLQVQDQLMKNSVKQSQMISISKELLEFDFIKTYTDLYEYIKKLSQKKQTRYYVFIDEVQEIESWEKAVLSLFSEGNYDIFITGSNAHLLSSELATLISGRYIEFPIYPLSFKDFVEFSGSADDVEKSFQKYIKFGGLPGIHNFSFSESEIFQYIDAIYNTILLKDIVSRFNIRNISTLKKVSQFLFDNLGNIFSAKRITNYLKNQKLSLTVDTVQNYTQYLQDAFLIHKVHRFDIKGKRKLEIYEKYYLNDVGLRHAFLGYRELDIADLLENVVYLELKRRGFAVCIGKIGVKEIDFIATKHDKKYYIQVCYLLASNETIQREISAFDGITDHCPKILITMDKLKVSDSINGIRQLNLINFLLNKETLQ
ncbi:MAG: ATPase [Thiotrichales bacterium]|nr:MAG: ATPase [Thiotrichales bacterium]